MYRRYQRLRDKIFTLAVGRSFLAMGPGCCICLPLRIYGEKRIRIGAGVYIGSDSWLQAIGDEATSDGPTIDIGSRVSISGHCTISSVESVIVEDDVLIARHVYIADHSHRYTNPALPIKDQGISRVAPVRLRRGAWLGQGVVVCPGVTIGSQAVIGANAVVTTDIPDFAIAVGAPARVVGDIRSVATVD